jgi:hypothetical protein
MGREGNDVTFCFGGDAAGWLARALPSSRQGMSQAGDAESNALHTKKRLAVFPSNRNGGQEDLVGPTCHRFKRGRGMHGYGLIGQFGRSSGQMGQRLTCFFVFIHFIKISNFIFSSRLFIKNIFKYFINHNNSHTNIS